MIERLEKWHQTKLGLLVFVIVELAVTYAFFSLSVESGNFIWYLLTLIFLIGTLQNFFKLIGKSIHGEQRKAR